MSAIRIEYETLEIESAKLEKQLEYQRRENDSSRQQINHNTERTLLERQELDALDKHAKLLDEQNKALVIELEKFSLTDDSIKQTLDRKNRVRDMKETMNRDLQKSVNQIHRSPLRNNRQ